MLLAGERNQVHPPHMDTLAGRLDYLGRNYVVFLGPLMLLQGVGYATSLALVWISSALIALLVLNKIRMMMKNARAPR
jgi:Flp pilus assembly protein TadB